MKSIILTVIAICLLTSNAGLAAQRPPNFVIIFIDDMGYGDIGPFGSTKNATPHLDQMAKEGLQMTSFYVASSVCKWHLGDQPEFLPTNQGFDTYFGIPYSNDMWPGLKSWPFPDLPVLEGTKVKFLVKDMDDQAKLCKQFTEEAVKFITANKDKPFFCYLPHAFVHWPRLATPEFMANAKSPEEGQVEEIDWSAGQILKTIRKLKLENDTIVLFTSDNGPAGGLSAGPLRGRKGSGYEGGHRVPTVVWGPGRIPAASVCNEMATSMDLLPTFARLAGGSAPTDRVIDGKDIWPLLSGVDGANTPHDSFFYQQGGKLIAVRHGDWKLYAGKQLFNLKDDLGEKKNVAAEYPEKVELLKKVQAEFAAEVATNKRPVGNVATSRTLVPRPGVDGEEGFKRTLSIRKNPAKKK